MAPKLQKERPASEEAAIAMMEEEERQRLRLRSFEEREAACPVIADVEDYEGVLRCLLWVFQLFFFPYLSCALHIVFVLSFRPINLTKNSLLVLLVKNSLPQTERSLKMKKSFVSTKLFTLWQIHFLMSSQRRKKVKLSLLVSFSKSGCSIVDSFFSLLFRNPADARYYSMRSCATNWSRFASREKLSSPLSPAFSFLVCPFFLITRHSFFDCYRTLLLSLCL